MADTAEQPLTESDIQAAIQNLDFFAVRLKGVLVLSSKLGQIASLLAAEREKRRLLADLDQQAAAVREVVAAADTAQVRLDGIAAELERHRAAADAEAESITDAARSAAASIEANARAHATLIIE